MSGALKVGDVFVAVSASLGEFSKGVDKLLKDVEKAADAIAKNMQEAADAVGGFSENLLGFAAVAGAAVAAAAERYEDAERATDDLTSSVMQLSAEVGRIFIPLVRDLERGVRMLTATWRGLSSETKASIVTFVRYAAIIGGVGMAMSRALLVGKSLAEGVVLISKATRVIGPSTITHLADATKSMGAVLSRFGAFMKLPVGAHLDSLSSGLASLRTRIAQLPGMADKLLASFRSMGWQLATVSLPILAVVAAAGALAFLAGVIYDAWTDTSTGLKDAVTDAGQAVVDLAKRVQKTLVAIFKAAVHVAGEVVGVFVDVFTQKIRDIAAMMESIARRLGRHELADNMAAIQRLTATGVSRFMDSVVEAKLDALEKGFDAALKGLSSVGGDAIDAVTYSAKRGAIGLSKMWDDSPFPRMLSELKASLGGTGWNVGDPDSVRSDEKKEDIEARYADWLRKQDANLRTMIYTDALAANRALAAEAESLARTMQQVGQEAQRYDEMAALQAEANLEAAREASAARASEAQAAMESWQRMRDEARRAAETIRSATHAAREALGNRLMEATGVLPSLVESFSTGMAALEGNLLGGLVGILGDLLMKSEGFASLMGMVGNMFQRVADIVGTVLAPLEGLFGAISMILDGVVRPLTPLFGMVAGFLKPVTPALVVLGDALAAVAPVFTILTQIVLAVLQPLQLLAGPAMTGLWYALKGVAFVIMGVAWAIGTVWNGIVSAVQWVFRSLGEIEIFGARPLEALSEWADSMESAKAPVDELEQSMANLRDMSIEEAQAKAAATAEQLKNTQAVKEATEALTNVPPAWRFARNKYLSQDAQSGPSGAAPAPSPTNTAPSAPAASTPAQQAQSAQQAVTVEQVYNLVMQGDLKTALEQAKRLQRDAAFRLGRALPGLFAGGV